MFKNFVNETELTPAWHNAAYAHLTPLSHAIKNGFQNYWNIDADDTIFMIEPQKLSNYMLEIEQYADVQDISLFSLDMHHSNSNSRHWSYGITYTRNPLNILNEFTNNENIKQWLQYKSKNLYNETPFINIDWYTTFIRLKNNLKIDTFYINNVYFLHYSNPLLYTTLSLSCFTDNKIIYPIFKDIYGIDNIMISEDEEKIELELFKQEQQYKLKLKEEGKELEKTIKGNVNAADIMKKTTAYAEKLSEMGKSSLAEYILHRKAVLDILENNLKYQDDNRYAYEESIHQMVFPMQQTSDDVDYTAHNLWLIDEKLSYHYYLASDKKIKSMDPIQSASKNEPDIAIFDSPFAFTDESEQPFRNITIIEFKRPGRESYGDSENPIQQVIEYMDDFTNGKIKTKDGLTIDGNSNIRFFCYILCDISEKLKKYIKQYDFQETPDGQGYYFYSKNYNAYMEIVPYNKMIRDSKKRNKILFDKLFNQ